MTEVPVSAAELASAIERWTGIDPLTYADERIAKLAGSGDEAGLRRFTEIAARLAPSRVKDAPVPRLRKARLADPRCSGSRSRAFRGRNKEPSMTPTHPGNEPDSDDMSTDPTETGGAPTTPDLPDDEAEKLGDLA